MRQWRAQPSHTTVSNDKSMRLVRQRLFQVVVTAVAFAILNKIGFYFQIENGVSIFYPATAVDVIACMYFGWWGALGVFLGCLATPWQPNETFWQTAASGLLNVLEGMIPYLVFRYGRNLHRDLRDIRSLLAFVLFGTVLNSLVSACAGTLLLIPRPADGSINLHGLFMWWVSDFSAALLLAMPLLAFAGDFFERFTATRTARAERTLVNALEITAVIILLGWSAAAVIQNYLAERVEQERVAEHDAWAGVSRLLTEVQMISLEARNVRPDDPRIGALHRRNNELVTLLEKEIPPAATSIRRDIRDLAELSEMYLHESDRAVAFERLTARIVAIRNATEQDATARWGEYTLRRSRINTVTTLMHGILLLVLFLASAYLIFRMSRPLDQMHREVKKLREGQPFDARRVETDFAELRTLALTLDETSKELHMREEELREQTAHALAASRAKSDFLARMSHELRTPLNSIIGFSELLLERRGNIPEAKGTAFLENIIRSGKHLLRLINELLDLAKIESGKLDLRVDRLDVRDLIWNATSAMSSIYRRKGQYIETNLPPEPLYIRGDGGRIEQVLLNLLSNASKFSPERASVRVAARAFGGSCEIAVTDEGPGIEPQDQWAVFEEFLQLHSAAEREGTGLGLPLAKRLVEAHGGTLTLESEPGKGATFIVRLPLDMQQSASAIA